MKKRLKFIDLMKKVVGIFKKCDESHRYKCLKQNWFKLCFLLIMILIVSISFVSCTQNTGTKVFKMSVILSEDSTWYKGAMKFSELVKERTNGKYIIKVFPNGELCQGNQKKELEMLSSGVIDFTYHSTILYTIYDGKYNLFSLPWFFRDFNEVDKVCNSRIGEELLKNLQKYNIMGLAWGENGFREITNNKIEIKDETSLKGLKIRVPGINMFISIFKLLGADPTVMNWGEVFTSLKQGTIDGQENPIISVIVPSKIYEVQKYLTLWHYSYDAIILGMNKQKFDGLDLETQKIFMESAREASEFQKKLSRDGLAPAIEFLKSKDMRVYTLNEKEIQEFRAKAMPVYKEFEDVIGKDLIDGVNKLLVGKK